MAKDNKAPKKEEKKPAKAPKVQQPPKKVVASEKKDEVEEPETINTSVAANPKNLMSRKHSGLSPDGQVKLLDLAHRVFVEETDPDLQFPQTVRKEVNKVVAVGIMCTFADHAANGDDTFALVLKSQAYPSLASAAKQIGIDIPDVKLLPAGTEEGTVVLQANKAKISKETKQKIQEERKIREGVKPELDPEKITSEEDVTKALEYMFTSGGKRLPELITDSVDFMKKFRLHEASLADNAEEAKKRFEAYNVGDWLDDIFSYFRPTIFFAGIGRGMAEVASAKKNPIHSFIILRDALKDKTTGSPVMSDQDIAYSVRSIVKWFCNTNIASNQKAIDNLDKEKNKTEIEKYEAQIQRYNDILTYMTNPSSEYVDTLLDKIGTFFDPSGQLEGDCAEANSMFNRICKSYYGKELSGATYKNLEHNIQQYAGCIINLFRDAGSQLANYKLSNIGELEKRSEEEKNQLLKDAKKAWDERRKREKEEEAKNA